MAARLGDVIYWAACIVATLLIAGEAYQYYIHNGERGLEWGRVIGAGVVWAIGRAVQYVLAGK